MPSRLPPPVVLEPELARRRSCMNEALAAVTMPTAATAVSPTEPTAASTREVQLILQTDSTGAVVAAPKKPSRASSHRRKSSSAAFRDSARDPTRLSSGPPPPAEVVGESADASPHPRRERPPQWDGVADPPVQA